MKMKREKKGPHNEPFLCFSVFCSTSHSSYYERKKGGFILITVKARHFVTELHSKRQSVSLEYMLLHRIRLLHDFTSDFHPIILRLWAGLPVLCEVDEWIKFCVLSLHITSLLHKWKKETFLFLFQQRIWGDTVSASPFHYFHLLSFTINERKGGRRKTSEVNGLISLLIYVNEYNNVT